MAMASGDELFAALVAASPPDELPAALPRTHSRHSRHSRRLDSTRSAIRVASRDPSSTALDADPNSWAADMERCFEGPRRLTHEVLPSMIENGFGRIVNVIGTFEPMHFNSEFAAWGAMVAWRHCLWEFEGATMEP